MEKQTKIFLVTLASLGGLSLFGYVLFREIASAQYNKFAAIGCLSVALIGMGIVAGIIIYDAEHTRK